MASVLARVPSAAPGERIIAMVTIVSGAEQGSDSALLRQYTNLDAEEYGRLIAALVENRRGGAIVVVLGDVIDPMWSGDPYLPDIPGRPLMVALTIPPNHIEIVRCITGVTFWRPDLATW